MSNTTYQFQALLLLLFIYKYCIVSPQKPPYVAFLFSLCRAFSKQEEMEQIILVVFKK